VVAMESVGTQDWKTLLAEISCLLEELFEVTREFTLRLEKELPGEEEVASFEQRRVSYFQRLQPLLDRQVTWLRKHGRADLDHESQQAMDQQLREMARQQEQHEDLVARLGDFRRELGDAIGRLRSGKRGLSGYHSSQTGNPARIYRRTA